MLLLQSARQVACRATKLCCLLGQPPSLNPAGVCCPATLGVVALQDVQEAVNKARVAQKDWVKTSFAQRGEVLKLLNDYVVSNQALICRVASRDTGKTMVDGGFGEVLTTCEKISWTLKHGEAALAPDFRPVGMLTIHKTASVEYVYQHLFA